MNKQQAVQDEIRFKGVVERLQMNTGWHIVRLPFSVEERYGSRGVIRVTGTANGFQVDRGLMPDGDGGHYIVLGTDIRKAIGAREGSEISFVLHRNDAPEEVPVPAELLEVFKEMPKAEAIFSKFNPGIRRSLLSWITSGKREETRLKRAVTFAQRLEAGYFKRHERD